MLLSKKIFISSSIVFAVLLIFLGIYNLAFKKSAPPQQAEETIAISKTQPGTVKPVIGKIEAISDEAVLSPVIDLKNSIIKYYSRANGKTYQIGLDGASKKTISEKELPGLLDVSWSPDQTKVISRFASGSGFRFFLYDYNEDKGFQLKNNLDAVVWQNNNKILYKYFNPDTGERSLNIADPDGTNWSKIADLEYKNVSIAPIPRTALISFWNSPDAALETKLETISILGGSKTSVFKNDFGVDYLWNGNGSYILLSHADQKNGSNIQLAITNDKGGEFKNLGIATFVSKAAWSKDNKTVFYALPSSLPGNSTLPNDYISGKIITDDSFWKTNVVTGEKIKLLDAGKSETKIDARGLFLNADESMLFFVNKIDGKLYRIDL